MQKQKKEEASMTEVGKMYKSLLERERKPKKRDPEEVIKSHTVEAKALYKKLEDNSLPEKARGYSECRLNLLLNHPKYPAQVDLEL